MPVDATFQGHTAMVHACIQGHAEVVRFLLDAKANPNFLCARACGGCV